jgi:glucose/arabinose dehydrogenase
LRVQHGRRRRLFALSATVVATTALVVAEVGGLGRASAAAPDLASTQLALTPVASGLTQPVAVAWRAGDARMYVAEKPGTVKLVDTDGTVLPTPVVSGVAPVSTNEQGLLGLAFSPDGTKLYIDHTDENGDGQVTEYTMSGDVADVSTQREILTIPHPGSTNHYGGELIFGPDGDLYIGTGDGGGVGDPAGNAQNLDVLLGKILRIDPTPSDSLPYTIPADNPFANQAGARGEIWMYGLRNPWRFSFDESGRMWLADVGQADY